MSDPVATKSSFLCLYMSNHPDTLVSYVKHFGKVSDSTVTKAKMTSIDTKGMTLSYQSKSGTSIVRVEFDPPLSGYEEVKPRLLAMKADAEESLGMTPAPQIRQFHVPKNGLLILTLELTTACLTLAPPLSADLPFYLWPISYLRNLIGGDLTMKVFCIFAFSLHLLESLYTLILVRRHRTGFVLGTAYVLSTIVIGFPVWIEFRKRVQIARIESIMKGT